MNRELRKEIRRRQVLIGLGGFVADEARANLTDCLNELCKKSCEKREVPSARLFIPTERVVRQSVEYYSEQEDGELADYLEWFANVAASSFVEESKMKDNFVKGSHKSKEEKAMECLFPMERFIVKVSLDMDTRDHKVISSALEWNEERTKKACKIAFDKYDYEIKELERECTK